MKKCIILAAMILLAASWGQAGQEEVRVLAMEVAEADGKDMLRIDLSHLEKLGTELTAGLPAADIRLLDMQDRVLADLGALKKDRIKWGHKEVLGRFLAVRFAPADSALLTEKIRAGDPKPGLKLAACDGKTGEIIRALIVTLRPLPDLAVQLNYPVGAAPGQSLRQEVTAQLENKGSVAARDIRLEIVLSGDDRIPRRKAPESATYIEDVLLENGRETIPLLEAGKQLTVSFSGSLKIPEDTPPGKHYLAVVADPEDSIVELSEENNVNSGFIMIAPPEPSALTVEMPETILHFEPATYGFKIVCADMLLSDGKDWKLCRMKPNIYHIKHVSWSDFFWEIDTYERAIYEIRGVDFCKKGGMDRLLGIKVDVTGGSLSTPPSRFTLKLAQTQLRFEPGTKKFTLLTYGKPIFHMPFWWICRLESFLYQFRYAPWEGFFLQVDTFRKEASLVSGGKFCTAEGSYAKLPLTVKVEN